MCESLTMIRNECEECTLGCEQNKALLVHKNVYNSINSFLKRSDSLIITELTVTDNTTFNGVPNTIATPKCRVSIL